MTQITFERGTTRVRDFGIRGARKLKSGKLSIDQVELNGEALAPTKRFWTSFFMRFGVSDTVFRYFEPAEVFERISERSADDEVRYCIERSPLGSPKLLAVSSLNRPPLAYEEVRELVERHHGQQVQYAEGVVTSTHAPRSGDQTFKICGDQFQHRFVMETPVDSFGHPRIHLSFLRMICSNGAIGYSRAFRSDVSLGKDLAQCIDRALASDANFRRNWIQQPTA